MFPRARVRVLMGSFIVPLPALIVLGLWIVLQIFSGVGSIISPTEEGGIAYMAHIGGFVIGFILTFSCVRSEYSISPAVGYNDIYTQFLLLLHRFA